MTLNSYFKEALRQLASAKLRAFLALLGLLVGTASVVAMVSIGKLAETQILSQFEQLGINLLSISVYSDNSNTSTSPGIVLDQQSAAQLISASPNITQVAPYYNSYGNIVYNGTSLQGSSVGLTPAMMKIAKLSVAKGRALSFLDNSNYYCVIGADLSNSIAEQGVANPVGSQIRVGNAIFTIVGILQSWPSNFFFNTDFNSAVIIPLGTAMALQKNPAISNIAVQIHDNSKLNQTQDAIKRYISAHTQDQQIQINSPKTIIDSMRKSSSTMTLLLGLIGSISLIVGGIGVMNIMLVSVAERQREIGIRLAIGARARDIQMQFLIEAVTLSILGGISGMLLGILVTYGVSLYSKWQFAFFVMPPIIGGLVSVMVGIFFGFYPARKASKLDPIITLRTG